MFAGKALLTKDQEDRIKYMVTKHGSIARATIPTIKTGHGYIAVQFDDGSTWHVTPTGRTYARQQFDSPRDNPQSF